MPTASAFAGGDGSSGTPYQITNCTELQAMNAGLSSYYVLSNNIDCSATTGWNSGAGFLNIGDVSTRFAGTLDGAGYIISDLFINRPTTDYMGMFGFTNTNTNIHDLGLTAVNITGKQQTGALIGYGYNTVISNVYSTGTVTGTSTVGFTGGLIGRYAGASSAMSGSHSDATVNGVATWSGGLVGETETAGLTITDSYATGNVVGTSRSGALIGELSTSTVLRRSYATGNITGTSGVGGLVGANYGAISDSYARGTVTGTGSLGGLVGFNYGTNINSYATGLVTGTGGGFLGDLYGGSCTDVFWDNQTTGKSTSACGTGKTTAETKNVATFTDTATSGLTTSWDFVGNPNNDVANNDYWTINAANNDGYPYLNWQPFNATPNVPSISGSSNVDGSYVADNTPTFSVSLSDSNSADTVQFRIQVDDSSDFSSAVVDYKSVLAAQGATTFTVGQAAGSGTYTTGAANQTLSDGNYYWRILATDNSAASSAYTVANSGSIAFKVDTTTPSTPGTPSTLSSALDTTPTWSWTASSDAGAGLASPIYSLQWSRTADFSSGVTQSTSGTNSFTQPSDLTAGTWYFRVKASDILGNVSGYSTVGSTQVTVATVTATFTPKATNTFTQLIDTLIAGASTDNSTTSPQAIIINQYPEYYKQGKQLKLEPGTVIYFCLNDSQSCDGSQKHSVTIETIDLTRMTVTVTIRSTPRTATLSIAKSQEFDVNNDGKPDIEITLNDATHSAATFAFKKSAVAETVAPRKSLSATRILMYFALLIGVLLIVKNVSRSEPKKKP